MKISRAAFEAIHAHGAEGYPNEICGILIGPPGQQTATEARRARNVVVDRPHDRYKIDDRDHMRIQREADAAGLDIVGYYHSHPDHPAQPSKTDTEGSWAGYFYIIVSIEKGTPVTTNAFTSQKDLAGPFMPEPLELV